MKVRFYLHNNASAGQHPIYMEARWAKHPAAEPGTQPAVRLSTGRSCTASQWNADGQRVKLSIKNPEAGKTNSRLNKLDELFTDTLTAAVVANRTGAVKTYVTPETMRAVLASHVKYDGEAPATVPAVAATGPVPLADLPMRQLAAAWCERYRLKYSDSYLRKMPALADHWERHRPGTSARALLPDPFTQTSALIDSWIDYLLEEAPQKDGSFGMENNSAGGCIRWLRALIKFAGLPHGWLKDELSYETEGEPLTYAEVMQLVACTTLTPGLAHSRDLFVFACFTGPRFSNLKAFGPESVQAGEDGVPTLEYIQIKGRRNKLKVRVPLPAPAAAIWQKYGGVLKVPAMQDFNRDIKLIAERAGLDRPVLKVSYRSTERKEVRGPMHQFMTSHTARHTYATLLIDGGADLGTVQNGLGHNNLQSTRRYAKNREPARRAITLGVFDSLEKSHTGA